MFDMMVTDYSSIFFDFLLDRPVTFHCPDLASYKADDRGMCLNYDEIAAGEEPQASQSFYQLWTNSQKALRMNMARSARS